VRGVFSILLGAAMLSSGCGGQSAGPQTYPVTGSVKRGGQPVAGAMVQFTPTAKDPVIAGAQVTTAEDGAFDVSLILEQGKSTKRGLPAGEYAVTVTKLEAGPGAASLDNPPRNVLPTKYASIESTPLEATVKAEGENRFDFEL